MLLLAAVAVAAAMALGVAVVAASLLLAVLAVVVCHIQYSKMILKELGKKSLHIRCGP